MGYNYQFLCTKYKFLIRCFTDLIEFKSSKHTLVWMCIYTQTGHLVILCVHCAQCRKLVILVHDVLTPCTLHLTSKLREGKMINEEWCTNLKPQSQYSINHCMAVRNTGKNPQAELELQWCVLPYRYITLDVLRCVDILWYINIVSWRAGQHKLYPGPGHWV